MMNLSQLLLGIWLLLLGITWLGWVAISTQFLGGLAALTGLLVLFESVHPVVLYKRSV